ncbi:uncharacterized protein LOC135815918 [Sycon ciliatum]|uniref:uncharacterized protein LOC135815918 n=1 Tax=Sycon ciliatum TaxID=27933 RepID=UPI0020A86108
MVDLIRAGRKVCYQDDSSTNVLGFIRVVDSSTEEILVETSDHDFNWVNRESVFVESHLGLHNPVETTVLVYVPINSDETHVILEYPNGQLSLCDASEVGSSLQHDNDTPKDDLCHHFSIRRFNERSLDHSVSVEHCLVRYFCYKVNKFYTNTVIGHDLAKQMLTICGNVTNTVLIDPVTTHAILEGYPGCQEKYTRRSRRECICWEAFGVRNPNPEDAAVKRRRPVYADGGNLRQEPTPNKAKPHSASLSLKHVSIVKRKPEATASLSVSVSAAKRKRRDLPTANIATSLVISDNTEADGRLSMFSLTSKTATDTATDTATATSGEPSETSEDVPSPKSDRMASMEAVDIEGDCSFAEAEPSNGDSRTSSKVALSPAPNSQNCSLMGSIVSSSSSCHTHELATGMSGQPDSGDGVVFSCHQGQQSSAPCSSAAATAAATPSVNSVSAQDFSHIGGGLFSQDFVRGLLGQLRTEMTSQFSSHLQAQLCRVRGNVSDIRTLVNAQPDLADPIATASPLSEDDSVASAAAATYHVSTNGVASNLSSEMEASEQGVLAESESSMPNTSLSAGAVPSPLLARLVSPLVQDIVSDVVQNQDLFHQLSALESDVNALSRDCTSLAGSLHSRQQQQHQHHHNSETDHVVCPQDNNLPRVSQSSLLQQYQLMQQKKQEQERQCQQQQQQQQQQQRLEQQEGRQREQRQNMSASHLQQSCEKTDGELVLKQEDSSSSDYLDLAPRPASGFGSGLHRRKQSNTFSQELPCHLYPSKFSGEGGIDRCQSCREHVVAQRHASTSSSSGGMVLHNVNSCAFVGFRKLQVSKGVVRTAGFCTVDEATDDSLQKFRVQPRCSAFTPEQGRYLIRFLKQTVLRLLEEEIHFGSLDVACLKALGYREICDICATTVFNTHFVCERCGAVVCLKCYQLHKNSAGTARYQKAKYAHLRQSSGWKCVRGEHVPLLTQVIPTYVLEELRQQLAEVSQQPSISIPKASLMPVSLLVDCDCVYMESCSGGVDMDLFRSEWSAGKPIIIGNVHEVLTENWSPAGISAVVGPNNENADVVDCSANVRSLCRSSVEKFWDGFQSFDARIGHSSNGSIPLLKLKDWPTKTDFKTVMPDHYTDLMSHLPVPDYTHHEGLFNLSARLPNGYVRPDLGPKMYIAYGTAVMECSTTNLHLDVSDAVNVLVHATLPSANTPEGVDYLLKDRRNIDQVVGRQYPEIKKRCQSRVPGALWHIYSAADAETIRDFLRQSHNSACALDPIHDQCYYLNDTLRQQLRDQKGVVGHEIVQCLGDAVFIPAGAPHQVQNLTSCIKVAEDFVSPEHIAQCVSLTDEFRYLTDEHTNHEDKLQVWSIIYHSVKEAIGALQSKKSR